jgi:SnoaL-like domain
LSANTDTVVRVRSAWSGDAADAETGAGGELLAAAIAPVAGPGFTCLMAGGALSTEYSGIDGLRAGWNDFLAAFEGGARVEFEDLVDAGEWVVDMVRITARPRGVGATLEQRGAAAFRFADGLLVRVEFHLDRAAALRAAGIA